MSGLRRKALETAVREIAAAKEKYDEIDRWRETPLTGQERITIAVAVNDLLNSARDWIKAVIDHDGEDEED